MAPSPSSDRGYEEDEACFTKYMYRPPEMVALLKSRGAPMEVQGVALAFPKTYDFVKEARADRLKRLVKHGLDTDRLLVFEIPYVVTYRRDFDPALALTSFQILPKENLYFRTMVFTENYVSNAHVVELEDTIIHESFHLREDEEALRKGELINAHETYDDVEDRIGNLVKQQLRVKYGRMVDRVRIESFAYAMREQSGRKTIISGYLDYWLHLFLHNKFQEYRQKGAPMTPEMRGGAFVKVMEEEFRTAYHQYEEFFNYTLPEVW